MGRLPLLITALLASPTSATVTVSSTGHQYHSRPAAFGFELEYGLQYVALLQFVESDVHLCAGVEEDDGEFNDGRVGEFGEDDDWGYEGAIYGGDRGIGMGVSNERRGLRSSPTGEAHRASLLQTIGYQSLLGAGDVVNIGNLRDDNDKKKEWRDARKNETQKEIPVVPSNGVPVAILAKRGQCTYETKARVASTLTTPHGTVRFVIVYDNLPSDGNHLITMMPEEHADIPSRRRGHGLWKGVGLVFVSYESGVDLREFLEAQSHAVTAAGGPRILIDGRDRWIFPPMDESAAGLAFLLMLFGCVCSLSLFLNTTFYGSRSIEGSAVDDRHLFLLGPDGFANPGNNQGTGRRGNSLRLLTREEVETLPTREYSGDSSDGEISPRSSSSGLELRDKSEMPYLAGEERNEGLDDVAAATAGNLASEDDNSNDDTAQGGGLCESLLPSKKAADDEEYYFRHNSCSICLDEYQVGEQIRVLPCQHTFHSDCIFPWLTERSPTCPLCKAMFEAVREEADEEEGGVEGQDDEEEEERTEASAPAPPPLDEEPPVHSRRRQRQRRGRRRSRQEGSNVADAAADAENANADPAPEEPSGQNNEEGGGVAGASPEVEDRRSSGLRGRLWGLFGGGTAGATTTPTSALEEPLLTSSDDDGNEEEVV